MDRKEVCALIREHELGEEVKQRFGDNYTRIPTKKLEELLDDYDLLEDEEEEVEDTNPAYETQEVDNPYEAACYAFVGILKDSGLLDEILATLK
jgi:hypothetical protein